LTYESIYAKEIAFFIDAARPNTDVTIDFSKAIKIAESNGVKGEFLEKLVVIDPVNNFVNVSLRGDAGRSIRYFSNYTVVVIPSVKDKNLVLRIREVKDE
jgi:nitrogen regulatory protein PII-like uncharacterized protein